jgi:hypothetical protein
MPGGTVGRSPSGLDSVEMTEISRSISKADAVRVLQRVGIPAARIDEILRELPDPIDLDHAEPVFARYGVTHEGLMNRLGASP